METTERTYWVSIENGAGYTKDYTHTGTWETARAFGRQIAEMGQTVEISRIGGKAEREN